MKYDKEFDGPRGLWNAIKYGDIERQEKILEKLKGVRYFISPDYTKCGDVPEIVNLYQQYKSHVVSIWLVMNLDTCVIPLVNCASPREYESSLIGLEDCETVAFNAKGPLGDKDQIPIFIKSVEYAVNYLKNLKSIVVYSTSNNNAEIEKLFESAIAKNVKIIVPDTIMKTRNRLKGCQSHGFDK